MTQTPYDGPGDDQHPGPHSESQPDPRADTKTAGPRVSAEEARDLGRLRRSRTDRKVAGVAGGLGRHLDIDPTLLRVAFVVLCFFGGAGFVLYGAAWLLVPEDGADEGTISASPSTRTTMLVIAGVIAALLLVSDGWWGGWGFPWPLAILGLVLFLVLKNKDKSTSSQPPSSQWVDQPGTDDTWAPPVATYQPAAPEPDRGPKLFWPTIALIAIALGSLNLYEITGGSVVDSAYPALALTVIGLVLVVGAWVGRAGGLIFLGIVAAVVLAASSVTSNFDGPTVDETPVRVSQLENSYYLPAGSIRLDLTDIEDVQALNGRTVDVEANVGEIVVTVPDNVSVDIAAEIDAGGDISVPGESRGGNNINLERTIDGGVGAPELDLNLDLVFGSIEVRKQ